MKQLYSQNFTGSRRLKLQPLHHSREVSALRVLYVVHKLKHVQHTPLMMEETRPVLHNIRGYQWRNDKLYGNIAGFEQYLRCLQPKYVRVPNQMVVLQPSKNFSLFNILLTR